MRKLAILAVLLLALIALGANRCRQVGSYLFSDDFESGALVPPWTSITGDSLGYSVSNSTILPHMGSRSGQICYNVCRTYGTQTAPTLSDVVCAGGAGGNRYVKYTYWMPWETNGTDSAISGEANRTVASGRCLKVTSPASAYGLHFWRAWVSTTSGNETLQQTVGTGVAIGTDWTEPESGLVSGSTPSIQACPSSGGADDNRRFIYQFGQAYTDIHVRGYVYFQSPTSPTITTNIQRKLMYLNLDPGVGPSWQPVLNSWEYSSAPGTLQLMVAENLNAAECGGGEAWADWDLAQLNFDTWYCVEFEVILGSPAGLNADAYKLWVNGSLVADQTARTFRGTCTNGIQNLYLGAQSQPGGTDPIEEKRYWDDVAVSTTYIGP